MLIAKIKNSVNDDAYFKKSKKQKIVAWIIFGFFAAYVITLIYPFFWIFINSIKSEQEFTTNFSGLPMQIIFKNYYDALMMTNANNTNMLAMFGNSLFLVTASTLLTVIFSSCSAYVMSKYNFRGKSVIFAVVIFSMILPIVGTMPVMLKLFKDMGIWNTPISIIFIYSGAFGTNFLLLYSFFKNISWTYAEAAQIDGAGNFKIFARIMMPLALPAVLSVFVLTWIGLWNEYMIPRVFLPSMPTIAVGLFEISDQLRLSNNYTIMFASIIISLIPIIVVFVAFQKTIMTNTVAGGLKG